MTGPGVDKLLVSCGRALRRKYRGRWLEVCRAAEELARADEGRGLRTVFVLIDDEAPEAVRRALTADEAPDSAFKEAVDAVCARYQPEFLVLIGATDVIPHQVLLNPLYDPETPFRFPDQEIPSDQPYACDAPYSPLAEDFLLPSRSLGRIPGFVGREDPSPLVAALEAAAGDHGAERAAYIPSFVVSAGSFRRETQVTTTEIFGEEATILVSRELALSGGDAPLGRLSHFVNAHGDTRCPFVRHGSDFGWEVLLTSDDLSGGVRPGTVVAGLWCYAAELFDPVLCMGRPGLCSAYLAGGAAAFYGATNYTFGSETGRRYASLLVRRWYQEVLKGETTGEAARLARLRYLDDFGDALDPMDLKILAQFTLLGDPSRRPVKGAVPEPLQPSPITETRLELDDEGRESVRTSGTFPAVRVPRPVGASRDDGGRSRSRARRRALSSWTRELGERLRVPRPVPGLEPGEETWTQLRPHLELADLRSVQVRSWLLMPIVPTGTGRSDKGVPTVHLVSGFRPPPPGLALSAGNTVVLAVHNDGRGRLSIYTGERR